MPRSDADEDEPQSPLAKGASLFCNAKGHAAAAAAAASAAAVAAWIPERCLLSLLRGLVQDDPLLRQLTLYRFLQKNKK